MSVRIVAWEIKGHSSLWFCAQTPCMPSCNNRGVFGEAVKGFGVGYYVAELVIGGGLSAHLSGVVAP